MKRMTQSWVAKAEVDYAAAVDLLRRRKKPLPDAVCFHCQQCAEKYLKALLQEHSVAFAKIHDLAQLLALAAPLDPSLNAFAGSLSTLTRYAVRVRYPGYSATVSEATAAVKDLRPIRAAIRK